MDDKSERFIIPYFFVISRTFIIDSDLTLYSFFKILPILSYPFFSVHRSSQVFLWFLHKIRYFPLFLNSSKTKRTWKNSPLCLFCLCNKWSNIYWNLHWRFGWGEFFFHLRTDSKFCLLQRKSLLLSQFLVQILLRENLQESIF